MYRDHPRVAAAFVACQFEERTLGNGLLMDLVVASIPKINVPRCLTR